ncbi:MAG: hypothetical protein WBK91_09585 [Alphaproteobacteria bacterium]
MTHEERLAELRRKAQRVATAYFLRYGRIPVEVKEVLAATESLAAVQKFNPYHDDRGRFTFAPGVRDPEHGENSPRGNAPDTDSNNQDP